MIQFNALDNFSFLFLKMSLNGFYVGGPFNCSFSPAHEPQTASEGKKTPADKETETHKHTPPPRTAYFISQPFFLDIFARREGNPSMLLILLCLTPVFFFSFLKILLGEDGLPAFSLFLSKKLSFTFYHFY